MGAIAITVTTISSREFNQDVSPAKRAADEGPVILTDRGEPDYVFLRHDAYRRLTGGSLTNQGWRSRSSSIRSDSVARRRPSAFIPRD